MAFAFAEAMFGGNRTPELDAFAGEIVHELFAFGDQDFAGGEEIDVHMGVTDVAEDGVGGRKTGGNLIAIESEHFAILFDRNRKIRA